MHSYQAATASAILDFARQTAQLVYDLIETSGLDFRLVQCGAILFERVVVRATAEDEICNAAGLEEVLKSIGLPQYARAFSEREDLEWFLKLRTLYFIRLVLVLREVVFTDEDDDSKYALARQVLTLTAEVAGQQSLLDDLTSLDHSLATNPGNGAKDQSRTDIIQAWSTVFQRAAEIEVPGTKAQARTTNQWNQFRQTILMQLKCKSIQQLRTTMATDHPTYDLKSANKDALVKYLTKAKVDAAKLSETHTLQDSQVSLVQKLSDDIKDINAGDTKDAADDSDFTKAGWRSLSTSMSEASSVTGLDADGQAQVLATCNTLTTALCKIPDTGIESLVFKREGRGAMRGADKIGALSALQDKDAVNLKLHFRGIITPTSNVDFYNSQAAAVFDNVATTSSANGAVNLSLVVTKDTMAARAWEDNRFCPALLVKQLKSESDVAKPNTSSRGRSSGKGKGKSKAAAAHTVLALTLEESLQTIEGVEMKAFALVGVVPPYEDIRYCVIIIKTSTSSSSS